MKMRQLLWATPVDKVNHFIFSNTWKDIFHLPMKYWLLTTLDTDFIMGITFLDFWMVKFFSCGLKPFMHKIQLFYNLTVWCNVFVACIHKLKESPFFLIFTALVMMSFKKFSYNYSKGTDLKVMEVEKMYL